MNFTFLRKKAKAYNSLTEWLKAGQPSKRLILILSLLVGIGTGLAAIILKTLVEEIQHLLTRGFDHSEMNWLYLVYPAVGILLTSLFIRYIVRDDISHGVTKILYAISRKKARIRPHNRWTSIAASSLTIGFGGSVGAEAPIVLTGSAIGSTLGRRFHLPPNMIMLLVGCGAAGAVAGIFKAPIAGLVFVLEVLMLDLSMASLLPLLVTCITSACVSYAFYGTESLFAFNIDKTFTIDIIPGCILLGIFCGLVSLYFTRTMNRFERVFAAITGRWTKFALGSIVLSTLIYLFPALYGEGYGVINQLLDNATPDDIMHSTPFYGNGNDNTLLLYLALVLLFKVFASTATNGGGGCGGVFAPSLFVGCIAGFIFAALWDKLFLLQLGSTGFLSSKNCVLYGMAGVMSGVMHAPLTGIFLIAELTGGYQLFVPLMIVSVISYLTIKLFEPHSIYAFRLARKGQLITHDKDDAIFTLLSMESLIERDYRTVTPDMDLAAFVNVISKAHRNIFPVVDPAGHLQGVVSLDSVRNVMFRQELYRRYKVVSFMKDPPAVLATTDTLKVAAQKFDETKAWNLPVVDSDHVFVGFISRSGLFNSYRRTLMNMTSQNTY